MIDPTAKDLNYVTVAGVRSPGRARISGADIVYLWDVQQPFGMSGGSTRFRGRGLSKFTLAIDLWRREHFIAWAAFKKLLEPPTLTKPLVVAMGHPILTDANIKAIAIEKLGQPVRGDNGIWTSTSEILEYRDPVPAIVKPRGAIPTTDKGVPQPPKTAADLALEKAMQDNAAARARASGVTPSGGGAP
ncbi:hypothetical protein AKJ09_09858 [Labilithrix luteola]|uniref:Uncharacterized protein n=1 Tax=Labilithrix luteola TaxID=1391654 RepID=A0A0K1QCP1_9BACT|nr:hypothetical protein [Labilithrix luteola]AKV03195.1 hypothetical protein AKJ09_09858 [Labilithrix luteola]